MEPTRGSTGDDDEDEGKHRRRTLWVESDRRRDEGRIREDESEIHRPDADI